MRPELLKYASDAVPRYTSYPTALQFDASLTADDYRDNARDSNASGVPLSLSPRSGFRIQDIACSGA